MKEFIKKHKGIIVSILLTIIVMLTLYLVNGIFPFGSKIFGLKDFDHAYTPVYYKLWDVLHGVSSPLVDWNLGYGLNSFGSLIMNSLFYPTSLIIGLFPRNYIPELMSIVVLLKLVTITIITYYVLNKLFPKTNDWIKVTFTLLYTFSSWTIFMMFNLLYLDVVGIFPLFILAYYRLLKDNKWIMYYLILTLCLLSNYYMSWMILFFILGCTPLSLIFLDIKDKKKKSVTIVLLTIASLLSSCVLFLPSFYQSMTSTRMTTDIEPYYNTGVFLLKVVYLFPLAIPIYFTIKQLFIKKEKKLNIFFILLLLYLLAGIVLEPINRMWHTGSYSGMPFRYAYIPAFILILISMYYLSNIKEKSKKINKIDIINTISFAIITIIFIVLAVVFREDIMTINYIYELKKYSQFFDFVLLFIVNIAGIYILFKCNKKIYPYLLIILTLTTTITYNLYFFESDEQSSKTAQNIKDNFALKNDDYNYSDYTVELNINYPYILQVPSRENRIHIINKEIKDMYDNFKYYYFDTFLYNYGGTIFTDMLLLNKYVFTKGELNEELYTKIDSYDGLNYYEAKYNASLLIPYNGEIYNELTNDSYINQNSIYKKLFNKDEDIIKQDKIDGNVLHLEKDKIYYISYNYINDYQGIELNDNIVIQKEFNKGKYNLELYAKEDTDISIIEENVKNFDIWYIEIDDFIDIATELNNNSVEVEKIKNKKIYHYNAKEDTSLLIPVNYDENYRVRINNEEVHYTKNVYNMISIDVKSGENEIELEYIPKFKKEGLIISIVSILTVILVILLNKKFNLLDKKIILYPLFFITCLIYIGFFIKIYILTLF